jgi:cytochrome o ubiquinol oxidase subunit III
MSADASAASGRAPRSLNASDEKAFGFWIYLMTDAIIFALLFATFVVLSGNTAGGPGGRELFDLSRTFAETMLLLTSSLTFGFAVLALAARRPAGVLGWLAVTFLFGLGFVALELSEFRSMMVAGAGPDRSGFLSAFYTLIGTHGLHVSIGLICIAVMAGQVAIKGLSDAVASRLFRLALFWHFLDIVWIGIFSVVYLPGVL